MKLMKRILAIVCTFVMIISMATGVNAVDDKSTAAATTSTKGSITVTQASAGEEYKAYKILSLESYDENSGAYSYKKPGGDWDTFIQSDEGQMFFKSNENGYVTLRTITDTEARKLAISAIGYAQKHKVTPTSTATASAAKTDSATAVFKDLDLGYYVIESTSGTACNITTALPNATIQDKHDNPYVNKIIVESGTGTTWKEINGKENSVNLGDMVVYKTTINVKPGAKNYVLHDIMDKNLIFNMVAHVTDNNGRSLNITGDTPDIIVKPDKLTSTSAPTDGCTFELSFTEHFYNTYKEDINSKRLTSIDVEYYVLVSQDAPINTAMKNTTYLTYGDKNTKTEESETKTYTYGIPVFKYTGIDTPLADAKFILSKKADASVTDAIKFNQNGNMYRYDAFQNSGNTTLVSPTGGHFEIQGLEAGTYYLKETEAPKGYNKIQKSIKIEILADGTIKVDGTAIADGIVKVQNNTGSLLPSTGGMGTTLIYVVGSILVLASGIVLFSKRKEGTN